MKKFNIKFKYSTDKQTSEIEVTAETKEKALELFEQFIECKTVIVIEISET